LSHPVAVGGESRHEDLVDAPQIGKFFSIFSVVPCC
jgi:hypothetical protein